MKKIIQLFLFVVLANNLSAQQYVAVKVKMKSRYSFIDNYRMRADVGGIHYIGCVKGNAGTVVEEKFEFQYNFFKSNQPLRINLSAFRSRCVYSGNGSNGTDCGYQEHCYCGGLKGGTRCSGFDDDNFQDGFGITDKVISLFTPGVWHDFPVVTTTQGGYSATFQFYYIPSPYSITRVGSNDSITSEKICGGETFTLKSGAYNFEKGKFIWEENTNDEMTPEKLKNFCTCTTVQPCSTTREYIPYDGKTCGENYTLITKYDFEDRDTVWTRIPNAETSTITLVAPTDAYPDSYIKKRYRVYTVDTDGKTLLGPGRSLPFFIYTPPPSDISVSIQEPKCYGDLTGKITVNSVVGGYDTLFFSLKGTAYDNVPINLNYPDSVNLIGYVKKFPLSFPDNAINKPLQMEGLPAGKYVLTVENFVRGKKLCALVKEITINQPSILDPRIITRDITCHSLIDGKIYIRPRGGTSPYKISYDAGVTFPFTDIGFTQLTEIQNLAKGNYQIVVKDNNNCITPSKEVLINEPDPVSAEIAKSDVNCFGDSTGVIEFLNLKGGSGEYYISISGDDNYSKQSKYEKLKAGNYAAYVSDMNLCKWNSLVEVKQPSKKLTLTVKEIIPASCTDASDAEVKLGGTGGTTPYKYYLNSGTAKQDSNFYNVKGGKQSFSIEDSKGCKDNKEVIISQPDTLKVNLKVTNIKCFGFEDGQILAQVKGGTKPYNYEWVGFNTKDTILKELSADTYIFKVKDAANCSTIDTAEITAPKDVLRVLTSFQKDATCNTICNGSATVSVTGGTPPYSYSWDDLKKSTTKSISNLCKGVYTVNVKDEGGCIDWRKVTIKDSIELKTYFEDTTVICPGQNLILDAVNSGALYDWYSENGFASKEQKVKVNEAGKYQLTITNRLGCNSIRNFVVQVSKTALKAKFLLPGFVSLGDTVAFSEISWPVPDSVSWDFGTKKAVLVDKSDEQPKVIYREAGTYTVKLTAFLAGCTDSLKKNITFYVPHVSYNDTVSLGFNKIKELLLYPNPNEGIFNVKLSLVEPGEVHFAVLDPLGSVLYDVKKGNSNSYIEEFAFSSLRSGVYIMRIITKSETKYINFLVQ